MKTTQQLAKHFRDVHFGGNWTFVNLKDSLADVTWQEATTKLQANLSTVKAYGGDPKVMQQNLALMQQQQIALQKVGVYDDDLIAAGQAQLSTFQLTGSEINQLMPKMAEKIARMKSTQE